VAGAQSAGEGCGPLLLMAVAGFGVCIILFALSRHSVVVGGVAVRFGPVRWRVGGAAFDDPAVGDAGCDAWACVCDQRDLHRFSNELGAFESGLAAKLLGLVPSVIFGVA
jgi:hypothetical protein